VSPFCISTDSSISMDKPEEPVDNSKNIMTPFDGGFSLTKPTNSDNRMTYPLQLKSDIRISGYIILSKFGCACGSSCIRSARTISHDNRSYIIANQRRPRPKVHLVSQKTFHPRGHLPSLRTVPERRFPPSLPP